MTSNLRELVRAAVCATILAANPAAVHAAVDGNAAGADYYQRALGLLDRKDYDGAVILLKNALQADSRDLATRMLLGNTYIKLEDGTSAEKELLRARRDGARENFIVAPLGRAYLLQAKYDQVIQQITTAGHPPDVQAQVHTIRGLAYLAKRRFADAEESFGAAIAILPDMAEAHIGLANIEIARNRLDLAEENVQNALQHNPDSAEVWYTKAEVARLGGKRDEALEAYSRAIEIAPDYHRALLARARILVDRGEIAKAEADVAKVRSKYRRDPNAAYLQALILSAKKDMDGARDALNEADQILKAYAPDFIRFDPPLLLLSGVVSYFKKDYETAYAQLSQYHREVPQQTGARKLLAALELSRGYPNRAVDLLEPVAKAAPDDFEVQVMMGDALMRSGRHEESAAVLERAAAIAPTDTDAVSQVAMLRLVTGQEKQAVQNLENAIKRDPKATGVAMMLGVAQLRRGEARDALRTAELVAARDPKNASAYNLIAGAHLALKDVDSARTAFEKAVAADPSFIPAVTNLAKLEVARGNYDKAYSLYNSVLAREPLNGRIMMSLADVDEKRGQPEEAIRWLLKARAISRDRNAASLQLIQAYLKAGKEEQAIRTAEGLQAEDPTNIQYIAALANAYLEGKQLADAAKTFNELSVRAAEQKSAVWVYRAGVGQEMARDSSGARRSFEQALALNPNFLPAQVSLFRSELAADDFKAAQSRAETIRKIAPQIATGDSLFGELYMQQNRFADAATAFTRALELDPENAPLAMRAYRAKRASGDTDALPFAESWATPRKADPAALRLLATAYAEHGKLPQAVEMYESLLDKTPDDIALLNNLAGLYGRTGNPRALVLAEKAAKLAPRAPAVLDTYGWLLVKQGKYNEGLGMLRNAHLRAPDVPEIRYHMAVALEALGRIADARREVGAALAYGRKFDGIDEAKALQQRLTRAGQ